METIEYTLPTYWAVALLYGDMTGYDDAEAAEIEYFITSAGLGLCVGMPREIGFTPFHDCSALAADCSVYSFEVPNAAATTKN